MKPYPFLQQAFLDTLESSHSVGDASGWQPCHLTISNDTGQAFLPLYRKNHSWGEYVFDWAWANAYHQRGLEYYPKLVSAIPFTPATGPRIQFSAGADQQRLAKQLVDSAIDIARQERASSWHVLFPDAHDLALLSDDRLIKRTGVQYHWFNRHYQAFDDFLGQLASRKRKMIRRERRRIGEQGLTIRWLEGEEITAQQWEFFYRLYHQTYLKRSGGGGYLTRAFFHSLSQIIPGQVSMVIASDNGEDVAAALFFEDDTTLYGRYWGCLREYDCLHFELCYYQGIDRAIRLGLQKFDAGAQGEHKILRGFEPVFTHSLHWIANPDFANAIARFVKQEEMELEQYKQQAQAVLPYKKEA